MNTRWRPLIGLSLALAGAMLLLQALSASAGPVVSSGVLDPTFGTGGHSAVVLPGSSQIARAITRQPDGRIVVAGYTNWNTGNSDVLLARFQADGSLDTTFGAGGVVTTAVSAVNDTAYAVAVQPDGKIVAAGLSGDAALVLRYNADGSLDTTFGTGGVVTTSLPPGSAFFLSVAVLSDGRILAGGGAVPPSSSSAFDQFLLARYQSNGTPDTTLGGSGVVTTTFPGRDAISWGMAVQTDGKVLLGGYARASSDSDFALARYNTDGSLDTSFGTGGLVTQDVFNDYGYNVAVQRDGRILLGGQSSAGGTLLRYQSDGSPDLSFGPNNSSNVVSYTVPGYASTSLADFTLGLNDTIVTVGSGYTPGQPGVIVVNVFLADGTPDSNFGVGGVVTTSYGTHNISGRRVLMQPDGKIVVASNSDVDDSSAYDFDMVVWRYLYSPPYAIYLPLVSR